MRKNKNEESTVMFETSEKNIEPVFLPCTLLAQSTYNYIELNDNCYRGSLILVKGETSGFSIINYCSVEDYLRGVVPLEIGKRSTKDIEAVKAQAIAARTYTYKKILERRSKSFDVYSTVKDQVYGGVNAEYPLSDNAILLTKGLVLVYGNTLINAYYHSTCGGFTANVNEVWNTNKKIPYLCSINDKNGLGKAFCSLSNAFSWKESWSIPALSSIIKIHLKNANKKNSPISGTLLSIKILNRFSCGRIANLVINTTSDSYTFSGDNIRFILRKNTKNHSILNSSHFSILNSDNGRILIEGQGFGHGVGMCQMGAIGRARCGQSYETILYSYYPGCFITNIEQ